MTDSALYLLAVPRVVLDAVPLTTTPGKTV